jgi:membrane protease YdiL (CAAX protease family)
MFGLAAGGGLLAFGALLLLLGLALWVLLPALAGAERARLDYGSHRVVLACTLLAAVAGNLLGALYFLPTLLLADSGTPATVSREILSPTGIVVAAVSLDVALLAVVYLRVVRPGAITWDTMGLSSRRLGGALLPGLLFGLLLFATSGLLEFLLAQIGIRQTQSAIFESVRRASPGEFGLVLMAGAVIAPIVEEIYFRGFVFRAYLDQKGPRQAFLFSAGLFALVHLNLPALLPIFAIGLLLSFLYLRTGSILPAIVAHGVNNAAAFTALYLGLV